MARRKLFITAAELESLPSKQTQFDLDIEDRDICQDPEMPVKLIQGQISFQLEKNMILCQGKVTMTAEMLCDRTLESFDKVLSFEICDGLGVIAPSQWADTKEITQVNDSQNFKPDEKIDILDLLRQYYILNLPTKILKDENCYNEYLLELNKESENIPQPPSPWDAIREQLANRDENAEDRKDLN